MSVRSDIIKVVRDIIAQAKKIVDLPSAPSVAGTDLIEVSIGGVSYKATASQIGAGGSGVVQTIVAGTGISVDSTDPANPIVSATGGGGSGTVTSFSAGNLSPLFTTNVANATTTPALTFSLANQSANLVFAGPTGGGAAAPTFRSLVAADIPDLSATYYPASNPNGYTSNAGTVTSVSFTGGLISVADPTTTPALTVAGTSGGIPYFSSASTWASSGALAANAIVIGGGAGNAPSTTTTGTGVLTFLGTPSWTNFSSMITGTAPFWSLASGGALTANNTITGAFSLTFNLTATASPFNVTGSYTVPAGAAINAYLATFGGTLTSKGTANDTIAGVRINSVLTNSTGGPVAHVGLRIDATATGSTTPANAISLQVLGMTASATNNEIIRGISNAGINRWQLRNDGSQLWTTTVTGTDLGGTMSTNASNNTGHLIHSFQLSGSTTTAHTHWGIKYTGGMNTNATNAVYYSQWDARSIVVGHTGLTVYGWYYDPQFSGAQAGTQTNYAIIAASGLSGFQAASNAPTAVVHIGAVTTSRASLRIDPGSTTTAPSSPNSGDVWHEGTNNRLMFRQGANSMEVVVSDGTTTAGTTPAGTIRVRINGTNYDLLRV